MAHTQGEDFEVFTTEQSQVRLDTEAVKRLLEQLMTDGIITMEQYTGCFKTLQFGVIKTARVDISKKPQFTIPSFSPNITSAGLADLLGSHREKMSFDKKLEGVYKTKLASLMQAEGKIAPTPADELPEFLRRWGGQSDE